MPLLQQEMKVIYLGHMLGPRAQLPAESRPQPVFQGRPDFKVPIAPPVETKPDGHGGAFQKESGGPAPEWLRFPTRFWFKRLPLLGLVYPDMTANDSIADIDPGVFHAPGFTDAPVYEPLPGDAFDPIEYPRGFDLQVGLVELPHLVDVQTDALPDLDSLAPSRLRQGDGFSDYLTPARGAGYQTAMRLGRVSVRSRAPARALEDANGLRIDITGRGFSVSGTRTAVPERPMRNERKGPFPYHAFVRAITRPSEWMDTYDALMSGFYYSHGSGGRRYLKQNGYDALFGRTDWGHLVHAYRNGYLGYDAPRAFRALAYEALVDYGIGRAARLTQEGVNRYGWSSRLGVQFRNNRLQWSMDRVTGG